MVPRSRSREEPVASRRSIALRIAVIAVLLTGSSVLLGHYGATYDEAWPHPTGDQLAAEYDRWVGERVLVWGTVLDVDAESIEISVERSDGVEAVRLTARGVPAAVEPGGVVQVHGRLTADRSLEARSIVVVDRDPRSTRYKYSVSALGVALVGLLLAIHWRPSGRGLVTRRPDRRNPTGDGDRRG